MGDGQKDYSREHTDPDYEAAIYGSNETEADDVYAGY
jgi:hypothetical protein